jgi:nucleotide-binding universal stress UspA family protein
MSASDLLGMKMLLATDGSEEAELATRAAIELAEGTGSELHVVYVEPLPTAIEGLVRLLFVAAP